MANQRDKNKKLVGFFATEKEKEALQQAAKAHGYGTLADFLRAVANGTVKVSPQIKAIALAAIGTGSGSGCLIPLAGLATLAHLFA